MKFPFRKKPDPKTTLREQMYADMKESLQNYTATISRYYSLIRNDDNAGSPLAQMTFEEAEVHRLQYYNLRIQYEANFGNLPHYQEKLANWFAKVEEVGFACLVQKPHDKYVTQSVLARL